MKVVTNQCHDCFVPISRHRYRCNKCRREFEKYCIEEDRRQFEEDYLPCQ